MIIISDGILNHYWPSEFDIGLKSKGAALSKIECLKLEHFFLAQFSTYFFLLILIIVFLQQITNLKKTI